MSDTTYLPSKPNPTFNEITEFLIQIFSDFLHIDPDKFDITMPFESYGIDSKTAVLVSTNLQEWLGIYLEATLLFDYNTIEAVAKYLYRSPLKKQRRKTVINFATEVFENAEIAEDWLNSPNFALGDKVPYDLLDTDAGIEQVRNLLGRIEYGVYS
jgi:acyl carrier protein